MLQVIVKNKIMVEILEKNVTLLNNAHRQYNIFTLFYFITNQ